MLGTGLSNPAQGLQGLRLLRRGRSDAPTPSHLHESLNKNLRRVQQIHATDMTDIGSIATRPIVSIRNQPLSMTGGLSRDIIEPFIHPRSQVLPVAHHDAKKLMLTAHQKARQTFPSTKAKAGL
jgi:hypothetical protein